MQESPGNASVFISYIETKVAVIKSYCVKPTEHCDGTKKLMRMIIFTKETENNMFVEKHTLNLFSFGA